MFWNNIPSIIFYVQKREPVSLAWRPADLLLHQTSPEVQIKDVNMEHDMVITKTLLNLE